MLHKVRRAMVNLVVSRCGGKLRLMSYSAGVPETECRAGLHSLYRWSEELHGAARSGLQARSRAQLLPGESRKGAKSVVPLADRAIVNLQQWLSGLITA